ncbi:hypothetical protein BpHYR1_050653 [Brachionus plicatilis]|uniref:Uncharacterized protein n=1 Tax=Brachionus plicatilis TaxID=10195 RepID=A0A3M7QMS4_BRAPC|nr:hypothetical protein BpHYR1_050653 [Brachionus plicatilis]
MEAQNSALSATFKINQFQMKTSTPLSCASNSTSIEQKSSIYFKWPDKPDKPDSQEKKRNIIKNLDLGEKVIENLKLKNNLSKQMNLKHCVTSILANLANVPIPRFYYSHLNY